MKIVQIETLISIGPFPNSEHWKQTFHALTEDIRRVEHPAGTGKFTIYPQSGKKRGEGNGVAPIKNGLMNSLTHQGWKTEQPMDIATRKKPGPLDAVLFNPAGNIALEWETGNISSSHRALNKLCLGLMKRKIAAGILIVPSRKMYPFLTDRIGNFPELEPYLDLWRAVRVENGVLVIVVIEHDEESFDVPRIPKGTDGRARS